MKNAKTLDAFVNCEIVSLDFETISLTDKNVELFSMAGYVGDPCDDNLVVGAFMPDQLPNLFKFLPKRRVVFWHHKFDGQVLHGLGFDVLLMQADDAMIMAHLLDEASSSSLKVRAKADLGIEMAEYSEEVVRDFRAGKRGKFIKYSEDDAIATLKLFYAYRPELKKQGLVTAYLLEMKASISLMFMEINGVGFDFEKADQLEELGKKRAETIEDRLFTTAGRIIPLTSPQELARFLYDEVGIPYKEEYSRFMKTKGRSVRREVLDEILFDLDEDDPKHELVSDLIEHKRLTKMLTSFFSGQREAAKLYGDGRVRSSFNQTSIVTGRIASSGPNLQQLPTQPIVKGDNSTAIRCMYVPEKGNVFIDNDFSQIELRVLAHFSKDPKMIKAYEDGVDYHQMTVDMTGGAIDRRAAKIANFGKLYGLNPYSFAKQARISRDAAFRYYRDYDAQFPSVNVLAEDVVKSVISQGYVRMIGGRKRRLEKGSELDQHGIRRMYLNALIQGSAAIVMKLAMIKVFERFKNRDVKMCLTVHDELLSEVDKKYAKEAEKLIVAEMESCIKLRVPLVAGSIICNNFGEAKD